MLRRHTPLLLISTVVLFAAAPPTRAQKGHDPNDWTREEMVAVLVAALGLPDFTPPPCVPGHERFDDVPASNPFCPWIEELARRGVTGGCGGGNYCPAVPVTRAQMSAFLVRTQFPSQVPPGVTVVGRWGLDVHTDGNGDWGTSISYPAPMPVALEVRYLEHGEDPTNECPGTGDLPAAAPGFLCVYGAQTANADFVNFSGGSRFGATIFFVPEGGGDMYAYGTWAATGRSPSSSRSQEPQGDRARGDRL